MKYWIGLDIGIKWTGIAISNSLDVVKPEKTVRTENLLKEIKNLDREYDFKGIVLGFPLTTKGKVGQRAKFVQKIKEEIEKELDIPIKLYDERFTTKEAIEIVTELGKKKDRKLIDKISASLILKGYLEEN